MTRKIITISVGLVLIAMMFTACGSSNKLSGEYTEQSKGTVMTFNGNHVTVDGYTVTYKIEDGIITMTSQDKSIDGTYDAVNDTITIEGEVYTKSDGSTNSDPIDSSTPPDAPTNATVPPDPVAPADPDVPADPTPPAATGTSSYLEFLQEYEAWVDEYVAFMKKYKANPSDVTLLMDYSRLVGEMTEWSKKSTNLSAGLTGAELKEYLAVNKRILAKLASVY
jgi:hypothetical protein